MSTSSLASHSVKVDALRLTPLRGDLSYNPIDLSGNITKLEIYENLFSPVLTGKMVVQDPASWTTTLPMFGVEVVGLQFSVWDNVKNVAVQYGGSNSPLRFVSYKQSNRVPRSFGDEMYTLNLASAEMYSSAGLKISRAFENMRAEEIIQLLLEKKEFIGAAEKAFSFQKTETPLNFVAPYMSPLEIIQLASLMGQSGKETNYLFYETLQGFHFKSIRQMIKDATAPGKYIPNISRGVAGLTKSRDNLNTLFASQIDLVVGYDMLSLTIGGYFASVTFGVDVLSGRCRKTVSRSSEFTPLIYGEQGLPDYPKVMGKYAQPTSRIFLVPTLALSAQDQEMQAIVQGQGQPKIADNQIERTLDGRSRELMALSSRVIRLRMSGVPNIHAGSIVNIILPSPLNNKKIVQDTKDIATGRYLVVAVTHSLIAKQNEGFVYETTIEACSDSTL